MENANTSQPKILLGCPVSMNKDYIMHEWLVHIKNLTYPNYDIYLVDNSHDPGYHKKFEDYEIEVDYFDPVDMQAPEYITHCQNMIRKRVLDGGYNGWLSLECDNLPPRNVIEALMIHNVPVVTIPYFIGLGYGSLLGLNDIEGNGKHFREYTLDRFAGFLDYDGTLRPSYANGIGCTLIQRWVLEKIEFRITDRPEIFADSYFYEDMFKFDIPNFIDTALMCKHYNSDWSKILEY